MNHTADLTQPLKNLLHGLAEQAPAPLLPALSIFAHRPVSEQELLEFVDNAEIDDPGVTQLRLALTKWDTLIHLGDEPNGEIGTLPGTLDRRATIIRILGLSDEAEGVFKKAFPIRDIEPTFISREFVPWYEEAIKTTSFRRSNGRLLQLLQSIEVLTQLLSDSQTLPERKLSERRGLL